MIFKHFHLDTLSVFSYLLSTDKRLPAAKSRTSDQLTGAPYWEFSHKVHMYR